MLETSKELKKHIFMRDFGWRKFKQICTTNPNAETYRFDAIVCRIVKILDLCACSMFSSLSSHFHCHKTMIKFDYLSLSIRAS